MYVLALEASTQAAKAAIIDQNGHVAAHCAEKYPPGVSDVITLDADGVFDALIHVGRRAVAKAGVPIAAAGLCTIWQSLLPLDSQGRPLSRAWTWAHTGAGERAAAMRRGPDFIPFYKKTGCVPHSQLPAVQIPCLPGEIRDKTAQYASLSSYLMGRLTGQSFYSRCTLSGSGLMDLRTREYTGDIPLSMLPPLCEPEDTFPLTRQTAEALGIGRVPLAAGGGDGALNQIGSGALQEGIMTCSVGTSAALRTAIPAPRLSDPPATWCYYGAQGWYIAGAATSGACNCVDWTRDNLLGGLPFPTLEKHMLAAEKNWADAPIFLPFLWGERCPGWQDQRRGGLVHLRGGHGTGDIYYAALEGVLLLLRMCYDRLTELSGIPQSLNISGGIARSAPWLQMAADIFGRPLQVNENENASLMGAGALALSACGMLPNLGNFPAARGKLITPNPELQTHYQNRLNLFLQAYGESGADPNPSFT